MKNAISQFIKRGGLVKVGTLLMFIGIILIVAYFILS
jgi:hypothetical protein